MNNAKHSLQRFQEPSLCFHGPSKGRASCWPLIKRCLHELLYLMSFRFYLPGDQTPYGPLEGQDILSAFANELRFSKCNKDKNNSVLLRWRITLPNFQIAPSTRLPPNDSRVFLLHAPWIVYGLNLYGYLLSFLIKILNVSQQNENFDRCLSYLLYSHCIAFTPSDVCRCLCVH